jgi:argininosuccinate synthase
MQIVLAYSGGLDTSVLLKQYIEAGHDVVAMTLNLGESDMVSGDGSQAALDAVRQKASLKSTRTKRWPRTRAIRAPIRSPLRFRAR